MQLPALLRKLPAIATLGLAIAGLTACQPIGSADPLDQDAFATESAPVIPVDNY